MSADIIEIGDADGGHDQLTATVRNGALTLTLEEPWAGDTETGFGRSCSMCLSPADAAELAQFLLDYAGSSHA
jgi:hypothetical protein